MWATTEKIVPRSTGGSVGVPGRSAYQGDSFFAGREIELYSIAVAAKKCPLSVEAHPLLLGRNRLLQRGHQSLGSLFPALNAERNPDAPVSITSHLQTGHGGNLALDLVHQ